MAIITETVCVETGRRGDYFEVYVTHEDEAYVVHLFVAHGTVSVNKDVDGLGDWWVLFPQDVLDEAMKAEFEARP